MPTPLTNAEKIPRLKWVLAGDTANAVQVYLAFSGSIFLLFLDKLGLNKTQIGVILGILPFCTAMSLAMGPVAARLGPKRVYVTVWEVRAFVLALMILAPWVPSAYAFAFTVAVIGAFASLRAIGMSASAVWGHEMVPHSIRGKFSAISTTSQTLAGVLTVAAAGWALGPDPQMSGFQRLFLVALAFGVLSASSYLGAPGGGPISGSAAGGLHLGEIFSPLRDKRFTRFMIAWGVMCIGWVPMATFVPLFMKQEVNLPSDWVVSLDSMTLFAGLLVSFFWGWLTDRYGAKPVMLAGLIMMMVYPAGLLLLPRGSQLTIPLAMALAFAVGLAGPGWNIGYSNYLFNHAVPEDRKTSYLAFQLAFVGLMTGVTTIVGGLLQDWARGLIHSRTIGLIHIDATAPFFIAAVVMLGGAVLLIRGLPGEGGLGVRRLAGMFVQGNPVAAIQALIIHQFAGQEERRVAAIERLGEARSPLSVDELIDSLDDPSFNVRYEAVISIARTRQDSRLTWALIGVLSGPEADLRSLCVWALGRMGDKAAIPFLREMLVTSQPLMRARVARTLGLLGDHESGGKISELFAQETDAGNRASCAIALAALGREDQIKPILDCLRQAQTRVNRREAALAVATLLGRDDQALRLWRRMFIDPADTLGGVMMGLRRRLSRPGVCRGEISVLDEPLKRGVTAFASGDMPGGVAALLETARVVHPEAFTPVAQAVLADTIDALGSFGCQRPEYIMLAVHTLHVGHLVEG